MPLGGVGCGHVAVCGDGSLRQWQLFNQVNHRADLPGTFFALRASVTEPPLDVTRVLQSKPPLTGEADSAPLVSDAEVPSWQRELLEECPGVQETVFTGAHPLAHLEYRDEELPLAVECEAFSPLVPLDEEASAVPAVSFTFRLRNTHPHTVHGWLCASLQNAVGWDGVTPGDGARNPLLGGNVNDVRRAPGETVLVMTNPSLQDDHPGSGQMALSVDSDAATYERWTDTAQLLQFLRSLRLLCPPVEADYAQLTATAAELAQQHRPAVPGGPSPQGLTWNGTLAAPFLLDPGEETQLRFIVSWHFPNRYVNFQQFGLAENLGHTRFWLGNHYATRFAGALDAGEHLRDHHDALREASASWLASLRGSSLPGEVVETLESQGALVASPTTFRTADGSFFGFEGGLGASTAMWNGQTGGSCPLNCTHVWNYEHAVAQLFPVLERSMRDTEFDHTQAPEGYIPHRVRAPLYLRQMWNEPIGGPTDPAIDGMLGTVLKTYREARTSGGAEWLRSRWESLTRLMGYVGAEWDTEGDGVLRGAQGVTHDIHLHGPNTFVGTYWLAALRAMAEMARTVGDGATAARMTKTFEAASAAYDELLWNGEYYEQQLTGEDVPHEYGEGCLSDQLIGQWWAHLLDLGHLLPADHVRTALRSVHRHNFRTSFRDFEHGYRVYADRDDAGLLLCTWPRGGRPRVPVRYADEVWTGTEYQYAAACLAEGLRDEALSVVSAVRARYDGLRRNPFNEIECGDHYSRAMAGFSLLDAATGVRWNGLDGVLTLAADRIAPGAAVPYIAGTGWGVVRRSVSGERIEVGVSSGTLQLRGLELRGTPVDAWEVRTSAGVRADGPVRRFAAPAVIDPGNPLGVSVRTDAAG
ncbi:GH116 family glycosyl-hydrolase [Streptomyces bathyalis]|nr:GH116 family glycosyl-hydrolase [Streptomyces bathyalis]